MQKGYLKKDLASMGVTTIFLFLILDFCCVIDPCGTHVGTKQKNRQGFRLKKVRVKMLASTYNAIKICTRVCTSIHQKNSLTSPRKNASKNSTRVCSTHGAETSLPSHCGVQKQNSTAKFSSKNNKTDFFHKHWCSVCITNDALSLQWGWLESLRSSGSTTQLCIGRV